MASVSKEGMESLFEGHFETSEGIIIFVKPPQKKYSSLEVYCFLISLMVNQHLRLMHQQVEALVEETKKSVAEHLSAQEKTDEPEEISDKEDKKPVEDKPQSSVKKSKPLPKKRRRV